MLDVYITPFHGAMGIYLICPAATGKPTKIGVSRRINSRLSSLQTSHYEPLKIEQEFWIENHKDARSVERKAHEMLRPNHLRGEWFNIAAYDAGFLVCRILQDMGYNLVQYLEYRTEVMRNEVDKAVGWG